MEPEVGDPTEDHHVAAKSKNRSSKMAQALGSGNMETKTCGLPLLFDFEPHPCWGNQHGIDYSSTRGNCCVHFEMSAFTVWPLLGWHLLRVDVQVPLDSCPKTMAGEIRKHSNIPRPHSLLACQQPSYPPKSPGGMLLISICRIPLGEKDKHILSPAVTQ